MTFPKKTLPELAYAGIAKNETGIIISTKRNGAWEDTSKDDFLQKVKHVALGLNALGVKKNDKVALHSENSTEWIIIDLAILSIGAVSVPIYSTQPGDQIKYILEDSKSKVYVYSKNDLFKPNRKNIEQVSTINQVVGILETIDDNQLTYNALIEKGKDLEAKKSELFESLQNAINPDDLAVIMYTSGTTGVPKGVMLTHNNIGSNIQSIPDYIPFDIDTNRHLPVLSFLPLSHSFERVVSYNWLCLGYQICYIEVLEEIVADIQHIKPIFFATVPRLLEKLHAGFWAKARDLTGLKQKLFIWALKMAESYDVENPNRSFSYKLADKLVFSKLREALGGNLKAVISGGAALSGEIMSFVNAIGVVCSQGYGLTETSPVLTVVPFDNLKPGTCGQAITDIELKLDDDGEILAKGPNIMTGYYNMPEETAKVFTDDGWFRTGDIGKMDEEGFLYITDRKKALFKLSTGKYVAPQHSEGLLMNSMFIETAVVIGNSKKYCIALIIPDYKNIKNFLKINESEEPEVLANNQKVVDLIKSEVDKVNAKLPHWEQIKKYELLTKPFTIDAGELTPKLSVKKAVVFEKYADVINRIYAE